MMTQRGFARLSPPLLRREGERGCDEFLPLRKTKTVCHPPERARLSAPGTNVLKWKVATLRREALGFALSGNLVSVDCPQTVHEQFMDRPRTMERLVDQRDPFVLVFSSRYRFRSWLFAVSRLDVFQWGPCRSFPTT